MTPLDIVLIVLAFALILAGAEVFTNGIEWLGIKLNMSEGATGSILAAIGTATPETLIPIVAILFTNTADSDTRRAPRASATNEESPGVSIRLILRPSHSNEASAAEIDIWRACSSSSASETVEPSTTEPSRLIAPASNSNASNSDVFPVPRCPTSATLRIVSAGFTLLLSSLSSRQ